MSENIYYFRCGRPKTNGEPCRNHVYPPPAAFNVQRLLEDVFGNPPCSMHATPESKRVSNALQRLWNDARSSGWKDGHESGISYARARITEEQRDYAIAVSHMLSMLEESRRSTEYQIAKLEEMTARHARDVPGFVAE